MIQSIRSSYIEPFQWKNLLQIVDESIYSLVAIKEIILLKFQHENFTRKHVGKMSIIFPLKVTAWLPRFYMDRSELKCFVNFFEEHLYTPFECAWKTEHNGSNIKYLWSRGGAREHFVPENGGLNFRGAWGWT